MEDQAPLQQAKSLIGLVDLTAVADRLVMIEGWKRKHAIEAARQYRNYLFLRYKYPDQDLPPSKEIDDVWHAHILHTQDYRAFCKELFFSKEDQYLDHHPHIGKAESVEKLKALFDQTQALYKAEFGEYMYKIRGQSVISVFFLGLRDFVRMKASKFMHSVEH